MAAMREGARLRLDYSARSLWSVDRVIEDIRQEAAPFAAVELVLRGFGAYAGEVIARRTGGEWWSGGGDHWVRTPDGRLWDPIDEAAAATRATAPSACCAATPATGERARSRPSARCGVSARRGAASGEPTAGTCRRRPCDGEEAAGGGVAADGTPGDREGRPDGAPDRRVPGGPCRRAGRPAGGGREAVRGGRRPYRLVRAAGPVPGPADGTAPRRAASPCPGAGAR
ncbi:hypothetical protein GCM10023238_12220 [Streptomyces heliomycini]